MMLGVSRSSVYFAAVLLLLLLQLPCARVTARRAGSHVRVRPRHKHIQEQHTSDHGNGKKHHRHSNDTSKLLPSVFSDISKASTKTANKVVRGEFTPLKEYTNNFLLYDVNKDGAITVHELIHVTGRAGNVRKAFSSSDLDGDGYVTEEEFNKVSWGYQPTE